MADAATLEDLYLALLADTLSANEQMAEIVGELADEASNPRLSAMLEKTEMAIPEHNDTLRRLIEKRGGAELDEACLGMEGLVDEARENAIDLDTDDGAVRDAAIIHAVQQMSHYGIAGYGTAAAFARALGFEDDAAELSRDTGEIYGADEFLTLIAELDVNRKAA